MRAALRVLLIALLISPCLAEQPRGRLLVFGDDLGDTGNLRKLTNNSSIGYSGGRLTNGPVFAEYMATMLNKQLSSFAYAQSAIDDTWLSPEADGHQVPSLDDQIVKFADAERDWIRRKSEPRNSIVVISAGASDVLRQKEPLSALNMELSQKLVKGVFRQIDRVQKLGFDSIVVANLPALYALPRWQVSASVDTLRSFVRATNTLFRERLVDRGGGSASLRLWLLDVEDFQLVTANATFARSIGARNTSGACITAAGSCKDPADFVFYDDVHMDMRLHHLLGLAAATMVQGGDVQYDATYFGQLAKEYDIGVLYHTTATMFDDSSTGPDGMAATAAAAAATDPLLTVTSSSVANCSLTVMCTSVTQSSVVLEQRLQSNSQGMMGFGFAGIWWQQAYICIAWLLVFM
ncbi:hypothetical protein BX661DRAFT_214972 [Kickxella alabastrina]|uniref:uncharacterized protein n=1 Tax=Kickxella alabastrina TaxID=61397 RepID=UPI00221E8BFE|nr:uncharacterized protein BX661DRAFT_214972 [Kickxella alabastrina]KAI7825036.1 hypothetical protein BX661DRAFT_214972 [Kickxella alabastrina]